MIIAFLKGFGIGLAMIVFIGPVFFTLLRTSLYRGRKAGLFTATGIFLSDVVAVLICTAGILPVLKRSGSDVWFGIAGAALLFALGLRYLLGKKTLTIENGVIPTYQTYVKHFVKGFLVNFVNPFVFAVWIGLISYGWQVYPDTAHLVLFLTGILTAILITDISKVFLASYLKPFLRPGLLTWISRLTGIVLLGFAVRLFVWVIQRL